jgi:hypothetical protein
MIVTMSETWFSDNYRDLSVQHGVSAGFQFEFYCARCRDAYRTPFQPYKSAQASGWLGKAAGMFGGALGNAENVVSGMIDSGWANARDGAFQGAMRDAAGHFNRCAKCLSHVCAKCWNAQKGLCYECAPDAEVEIESQRARGEMDMAGQMAYSAGQTMGEKLDVKTEKQLVCPKCNAETHGAKFCPECGEKLAVTVACTGCGVTLAPGTKFCPECGAKQA